MNLSYETLLIIGILGFYLYDSTSLFYFNEIAFTESNGEWTFFCPHTRWTIFGKMPYLPNPLAPYKLLFRVAWSSNDSLLNLEKLEEDVSVFNTLIHVRFLSLFLLFELLVLLPAVLWLIGSGSEFYIVLLGIYSTIGTMITIIYCKRTALGITKKDFVSLAFDAIACPPFAINLVRKITTRHKFNLNPIAFAYLYFEKEIFSNLIESVQARLDEQLDYEEENSSKSKDLQLFRAQLSEINK